MTLSTDNSSAISQPTKAPTPAPIAVMNNLPVPAPNWAPITPPAAAPSVLPIVLLSILEQEVSPRNKSEIIALSKTDTISADEVNKKIKSLEKITGKEVFALSSVTNKGLEEILNKVLNVIKKNKQVEEVEKWSP